MSTSTSSTSSATTPTSPINDDSLDLYITAEYVEQYYAWLLEKYPCDVDDAPRPENKCPHCKIANAKLDIYCSHCKSRNIYSTCNPVVDPNVTCQPVHICWDCLFDLKHFETKN